MLQQAFILFLRIFIYFTWYIMIVIIKNTTRDVLCVAMSSAYSYHQIIFPNLPFCGTLMLKLFFTYIYNITHTLISTHYQCSNGKKSYIESHLTKYNLAIRLICKRINTVWNIALRSNSLFTKIKFTISYDCLSHHV